VDLLQHLLQVQQFAHVMERIGRSRHQMELVFALVDMHTMMRRIIKRQRMTDLMIANQLLTVAVQQMSTETLHLVNVCLALLTAQNLVLVAESLMDRLESVYVLSTQKLQFTVMSLVFQMLQRVHCPWQVMVLLKLP